MAQEHDGNKPMRPPLTESSAPGKFDFLADLAAATDRRAAGGGGMAGSAETSETDQTEGQKRLREALVAVSAGAEPVRPAALVAGAAAPLRAPSERSRSGVFAFLLVALTLLAPLPVGANRPLLWCLVAIFVGGIGAAHFLRRAVGSGGTFPGLVRFWPLLLLAALQPVWGLVQAVPLGDIAAGLALPIDLPAQMRPATISLDPGASLLGALRMIGHALFFLLALAVLTRPERVMTVLRVLFWGIVCWAIYGMVALTILGDVGPWGQKEDYLGFATGPFVNRNSFASFLGIGGVIGIALLADLRTRPKLRRERRHGFLTEGGLRVLILASGLGLIVITLFATGSRMGLLSSLLAMAVTGLTMAKMNAPSVPSISGFGLPKWLVAGLIVAVLAVGGVLFGLQTAERSVFVESDFSIRLQIFRTAFDLIMTRPLAGFGLDAFPLAFELARPADFLNNYTFSDAHSSYLENWAEGGLIFGSMPLLVAGLYLRQLLAQLVTGERGIAASAAALGALVLAALHSLVDFPFEIEANVLLLCLLCAMGVSLPRGRTSTERKDDA